MINWDVIIFASVGYLLTATLLALGFKGIYIILARRSKKTLKFYKKDLTFIAFGSQILILFFWIAFVGITWATNPIIHNNKQEVLQRPLEEPVDVPLETLKAISKHKGEASHRELNQIDDDSEEAYSEFLKRNAE